VKAPSREKYGSRGSIPSSCKETPEMSDPEDDDPLRMFRWYGFGSPVGLAILLVSLGAFLALLGAAIALPLSLFR
jgi:hypothetical protein